MSKKLVLFDHDGAIDDILATMLLMTMPHVQPLGIIVTPADCYINAALNVTRKLLDFMRCHHIPVAESTVRGIHPFPALYRRDSLIMDNFPLLNQQDTLKTPLVPETGQQFMVNTLQNAVEPVTLMVTGPLTTVATALEMNPEIEGKIKEIVWMGGVLNVSGNVEREFAPEHDGTAEWNAYWDAIAVERVWQTQIPLILCTLDITNTVPVTAEFIRQLAKQRHYPLSDLAGLCYALAIPQDYYCWDVLATAYLHRPELFSVKAWKTEVITTGYSQGRIKVVENGRKVLAMDSINTEAFHHYLLQQWGRQLIS
ncbi:nucleoside hydrolase [Crocosphaera sp. UHCC 0190]|uniref:nucleoside hydrolase n=1 Tax=Crocosphaera sp. UHCC 0190 TaxID=3110246 RepID=UPI002B2212FC|nr:nucleoside hydrolase [Crocosphaera sp. UHCC 0190]MEA5510219.1 nucleoside hydrolase [Crocosphaera sp. UHCC 0190]